MAKWQVRYMLPLQLGKYFYGEVEAETVVKARELFEKTIPNSRVIGNPRPL
jgi:hypothetical protein